MKTLLTFLFITASLHAADTVVVVSPSLVTLNGRGAGGVVSFVATNPQFAGQVQAGLMVWEDAQTKAVADAHAEQTKAVAEVQAAQTKAVADAQAAQTKAAADVRDAQAAQTKAVAEVQAAQTKAAAEVQAAQDAQTKVVVDAQAAQTKAVDDAQAAQTKAVAEAQAAQALAESKLKTLIEGARAALEKPTTAERLAATDALIQTAEQTVAGAKADELRKEIAAKQAELIKLGE